jgi:hypothetical protein
MSDPSPNKDRLIVILPLLVGLAGTALGYMLQGHYNQKLEQQKFEAAIIQKALETNDQNEVAKRLSFYVDVGIVQSLNRDEITKKAQAPSQLPTFPTPVIANARMYLLAPTQSKAAKLPNLRAELVKAGFNVIGERILEDDTRPSNPEVRYFNATDQAEAEEIAEAIRKYLGDSSVVAKPYSDPRAKPGYIEFWTGR